jgi:glycosyltransferase involved in cell wall biosynthesis
MRVAYDARHAARGLGISTFLVHLARELVALGGIELIWLGDPLLAPPGIAGVERADRLPYPTLDGPLGRALIRRLGVDVMHFTGNTAWGRRGPVPTVLTLQDLIFLETPVRGRSVRQIAGHRYERWLIERAVPAASVIAVPSRTIAGEVAARFGAAAAPRVVYYGVTVPAGWAGAALGGDEAAMGGDETAMGVTASGADVHAGRPYVVAFAASDPRKRTAAIIEGWRAVAGLGIGLRLLASAGLAPELRESLTSELASGAVTILNQVPRRELWDILAGALALAYPSSHEGFGLPVLEAMAAGTPVLSGLAPVTLEIGGDAIISLDARDISGSIAAAVTHLYENRSYARSVAERGLNRAGAFTWRATAEGYRELYREALE